MHQLRCIRREHGAVRGWGLEADAEHPTQDEMKMER